MIVELNNAKKTVMIMENVFYKASKKLHVNVKKIMKDNYAKPRYVPIIAVEKGSVIWDLVYVRKDRLESIVL